MKQLITLFFISTALLFTSCSDKEEGQTEGIILLVTPAGTGGYIEKNENDKMEFLINISSGEPLAKVKVTEEAENEIDATIIFEEEPLTTTYQNTLKFLVKTPPSGSGYYAYTFTAIDNQGTQSTITKYIGIAVEQLETKEAISLYSSISDTKQGGYNLIDQNVVTSDTSVEHIAFLDATDTLNNPSDTLSRQWEAANNTEFVKANSLKFEDATYATIQSTFEASNSTDIVSDLTNDDIIIVKYINDTSTPTYVLIKILQVNDNIGANQDSYIFNLKY